MPVKWPIRLTKRPKGELLWRRSAWRIRSTAENFSDRRAWARRRWVMATGAASPYSVAAIAVTIKKRGVHRERACPDAQVRAVNDFGNTCLTACDISGLRGPAAGICMGICLLEPAPLVR